MNDSLDNLRAWIESRAENETFSFHDFKKGSVADYDSVKDMLFFLLEETPASIEQIFDEKSKKVGFRRSSP